MRGRQTRRPGEDSIDVGLSLLSLKTGESMRLSAGRARWNQVWRSRIKAPNTPDRACSAGPAVTIARALGPNVRITQRRRNDALAKSIHVSRVCTRREDAVRPNCIRVEGAQLVGEETSREPSRCGVRLAVAIASRRPIVWDPGRGQEDDGGRGCDRLRYECPGNSIPKTND